MQQAMGELELQTRLWVAALCFKRSGIPRDPATLILREAFALELARERFNNKNQAKALGWMTSAGVIGNLSVAQFMMQHRGFEHGFGLYLMNPSRAEMLSEFLRLQQLSGALDDALRRFLTHVHLPGESQAIKKILEAFASHYYAEHRSEFSNAEAVYTLTFALIMLSTDFHRPRPVGNAAGSPMTFEAFCRLLQGD
jgi:hypothetical protein